MRSPRATRRLSAALLGAAVAAGLLSAAAAPAAPAGAVPRHRAAVPLVPALLPEGDPLAVEVLALTDQARVAAGCAPLAVADPLVAAAIEHSGEMADAAALSHTGPGGSTPRTRLAALGVAPRLSAENVAVGAFTPRSLVDAWLASPGHRRNLLDCRLGFVGVARQDVPGGAYWTQVMAAA